ncbi:MAG: transglycosylase SLT domain-containing protein [Pleurocapsa sp.]
MRSKQPQPQSKRYQARLFSKPKKLAVLCLILILGWLAWRYQKHQSAKLRQLESTQQTAAVVLRSLSPAARRSQLELLASVEQSRDLSPAKLRDHYRARYLLAADLIEQQQGQLALTYLQGLAADYPLLYPQILFKTAQAYRQTQQETAAQKTLKYLIKTYPQHPLTANALTLLEDNQAGITRLIREFPDHPITQKIVRQRLRQNPDQFELLMLLARYSRDSDLNAVRDRLVLNYPAQLTPEDWEAIADGYWRVAEHRKAADAYTFAAPTPRNLYRAARGFHRNGNLSTARRAYQRLIEEYHDAREAGQALIDLASISSGDEAVIYLEKAIAEFPQNAPQAYRLKANIHERFGKYQAANDSRQELLDQYSDSAAAAQYRWQTAQQLAAKGNKRDALKWMQPVIKSNQELDFAPKALYWTGKWAIEINNPEAAKTIFNRVIKLYPQSYWAWRSAVMLGWDVGDFERLSPRSPALDLTKNYSPLPMGSEALQELYFLGQYDDAWLLLQSEIEQPQQLSVNEQFTEGLLKLELGHYSQGMQEIWELTKRETPQKLRQWRALRQTEAYWHGLFPFPYQQDILQYAKKEQINPLLVISVMRKESTFDPDINSAVGAVGLMQIVPPTAQWVAEQIQLANYSLTNPEDNIKIGTWYLKHNHHRYQDDSLLAVASYNAGTSNVNAWLEISEIGDRDRFVEQIPFAETKDYVEGVFGNYWNYLRLYNPEIRQKVDNLQKNKD